MSRPQELSREEAYVDQVIAARSEIPEDPRPGNYVVIDVTHFSTTVLELFDAGASFVHVPEQRGQEFDFKAQYPEARIGGGSSAAYTPKEGYDFFNSPSSVENVDVAGRPAALTSSNGGAAVTDLRERGGPAVEVYVASLSNAKTIADHLRGRDEPTITVAAGSRGKPSPEDTIGAVLIHRYLRGDDPTASEIDRYREVIEVAKAAKYHRKAAIRYRDLVEYSTAVNTRTAVPKLEGQRLVDVSEADDSEADHSGADDVETDDVEVGDVEVGDVEAGDVEADDVEEDDPAEGDSTGVDPAEEGPTGGD